MTRCESHLKSGSGPKSIRLRVAGCGLGTKTRMGTVGSVMQTELCAVRTGWLTSYSWGLFPKDWNSTISSPCVHHELVLSPLTLNRSRIGQTANVVTLGSISSLKLRALRAIPTTSHMERAGGVVGRAGLRRFVGGGRVSESENLAITGTTHDISQLYYRFETRLNLPVYLKEPHDSAET